MDYGIAMEIIVIKKLQAEGYNIRQCGLFLDSEVPGIGASPDGLIDEDGILEIKSSFTGKDLPVDEVLRDRKNHSIAQAFKIVHDKIIINEKHDYYYQIQMQLRVTNRQYCLFTIATLNSIKTFRVERNEILIKEILSKAVKFYNECILPELLDSRRYRRMPIRESKVVNETGK